MKYSKLFSILGIGGIVALLLAFGFHLHAQNRAELERIAANPEQMRQQMEKLRKANPEQMRQQMEKLRNRQEASNSQEKERSGGEKANDSEAFYRAIIDNNIFRPLGWTPPRKEPEYALIGTAINPNGSVAKAFVLERRSNQFYTAVVGDKVGEAVVKEIKQREVTLDKAGENITLRTGNMQFLNSSGSRSSGRSSSREESSRSDNNRSSSSSASRDAAMRKAREAAEQNAKKQAEMKVMEMRRRFESASREQREQMIKEFRERSRGRRRGRD